MNFEKMIDRHQARIDNLSQLVVSLDKTLILVSEQSNHLHEKLNEIQEDLAVIHERQVENSRLLQKTVSLEKDVDELINFKSVVELRHHDEDHYRGQWSKIGRFIRDYWAVLIFCGGLLTSVWGILGSAYIVAKEKQHLVAVKQLNQQQISSGH